MFLTSGSAWGTSGSATWTGAGVSTIVGVGTAGVSEIVGVGTAGLSTGGGLLGNGGGTSVMVVV